MVACCAMEGSQDSERTLDTHVSAGYTVSFSSCFLLYAWDWIREAILKAICKPTAPLLAHSNAIHCHDFGIIIVDPHEVRTFSEIAIAHFKEKDPGLLSIVSSTRANHVPSLC